MTLEAAQATMGASQIFRGIIGTDETMGCKDFSKEDIYGRTLWFPMENIFAGVKSVKQHAGTWWYWQHIFWADETKIEVFFFF